MTTYFESKSTGKTGKTAEPFGPGVTARENINGKEYQLFIHIVDMLTNKAFRRLDKNSRAYRSAFPFIRRFSNGSRFDLKTEEKGTNGFPDFFLVRDDIVCIIDHSRIDSSSRRTKNGDNGTEYLALLGRHNGNPTLAREDKGFQNLNFSSENIRKAVHHAIKNKADNLPDYIKHVEEYIASMPNEIAAIDGAKPKEVWLLIEDVSPELGRYSDEAIRYLTAELESHPKISGTIYVYSGYPDQLPHDISDIWFIPQDHLIS